MAGIAGSNAHQINRQDTLEGRPGQTLFVNCGFISPSGTTCCLQYRAVGGVARQAQQVRSFGANVRTHTIRYRQSALTLHELKKSRF